MLSLKKEAARKELQSNTNKQALLEREVSDLTAKVKRYEARIIELQTILTKEQDKLTQAKELQHLENVIKQMTEQIKKVKLQSHT